MGKAKFGIFGDGKELPQIVLNRFFKNGDFRSGYYRDQTLLMAQGLLSPDNFFAALYAHTDLKYEPMSGGRQMGAHFLTKNIDEKGQWLNLMKQKNHSSDVSPTGSQMPRLVGLAYASKIYRNSIPKSHQNARFCRKSMPKSHQNAGFRCFFGCQAIQILSALGKFGI